MPERADTPLAFEGGDPAVASLDFASALERVAAFAAGPLGAGRILARRPGFDVGEIREELASVAEVLALFRRGDGLTAEPVPDVSAALARLRIAGSVLEGVELAQINRLLAAARRVHADLRRVAPEAPRAARLIAELPEKQLDRRLTDTVDADGALLDGASPWLAAARREVHAARARLVRKLETILRQLDAQTTPADSVVTMRNGRYVIPVRRDIRGRPGGIVHDESGSAGTLFVEPTEAIELGNAWREAQVAEEREVLRVLREVSDLLRPAAAQLAASFTMCLAVDDLVARARYALAVGGEPPSIEHETPLHIVTGRHPLLIDQGREVIPFDLTLATGERTVVITGPNTGGKTVLLKAVGLIAMLAQSGIVPPVAAGTVLPVFQRFYVDIGDHQSIAANLSTFSAHVQALRQILDGAGTAALVLLDEIGSGTDPVEGAALAAASLIALTRRGAVTLASTHLGALKELATTEPGVVNGSLQFDPATLTPTFRFVKGVPGRSYGVAIARRLGLDESVLRDAESRVPDAERTLDVLLAEAEARNRASARLEAELADRVAEAERMNARLALSLESAAARESTLAAREKNAERAAAAQARAALLEARQQVEAALAAARAASDDESARRARRVLEESVRVQGEKLSQLDASAAPPGEAESASFEIGARIRLSSGLVGQVLERRGDGRYAVLAGGMRVVTDAAGAERVSGTPAPLRTAAAGVPSRAEAPGEIDLRGLSGDEAEERVLAAIDAAVLAERPTLRIIHGMGTGVLRDRVRRVVGADGRVARYGFAPPPQGGNGVTIVEFSE